MLVPLSLHIQYLQGHMKYLSRFHSALENRRKASHTGRAVVSILLPSYGSGQGSGQLLRARIIACTSSNTKYKIKARSLQDGDCINGYSNASVGSLFFWYRHQPKTTNGTGAAISLEGVDDNVKDEQEYYSTSWTNQSFFQLGISSDSVERLSSFLWGTWWSWHLRQEGWLRWSCDRWEAGEEVSSGHCRSCCETRRSEVYSFIAFVSSGRLHFFTPGNWPQVELQMVLRRR